VITLAHALRVLAAHVHTLTQRQFTAQGHPLRGAYTSPAYGIDDASAGGTADLLASSGLLVIASITHPGDTPPHIERNRLLHHMDMAADYLLRVQRPGGLIDLRSANYDSAPDTGFVVQMLCAMLQVGLPASGHDGLAAVMDKVELFVRRAVAGMVAGGFHTPNHRWVIASALAQAAHLFPDLAVQDVIRAYLAEGFDVDSEGAYLERSSGVYDAVSNRSLLLLADFWPQIRAQAQAAARANLDFNLHLLHADATTETGLSRRQDHGLRPVPTGLIACYLLASVGTPTPGFLQAACYLWQKVPDQPDFWTTYVLLRHGDTGEIQPALPDHYLRFFPVNQLWRVRRGQLSASVFGGTTRLMTLVYGAAALTSLRISQSYFGAGRFTGDELSAEGDGITLHSRGDHIARRPGYDLPLSQPVAPQAWDASRDQRPFRPVPPARSVLSITAVEHGFDLHFRTLDGLDDVTGQIALDFPAGGIWETSDTAFHTQPGQVIFLRRGYGRMRFGDDWIGIGPGTDAHRTWHMRDAEPVAADQVRVLLPFLTPFDHRLRLRVASGLHIIHQYGSSDSNGS
jgi:hypothetical protein